MVALRKHEMVLFYRAYSPGKYAMYDSKFGIPLYIYTGGALITDLLSRGVAGLCLLRREISSEFHESVSVQRRSDDIRVIHTWYGENYTLYTETYKYIHK